MKKIIFDQRWEGGHGIGRFSQEITKRIRFNKYIRIKIKPTNPIDIFITPWYLIGNKHIYFTPGFNAPWFFVKRAIITIHDLNHIDSDVKSGFLKKLYYNLVMKRACRKSLSILTVSEFSKKRIIEWSGVDSKKIVVVGNGVSASFTPEGSCYNPGFKYIFCVSNRKPHKNEKRLIEAYSKLNNNQKVKLLISGKSTDELDSMISEFGLRESVLFTGYIEDEDLPSYYRGALALIMPSLYEGFGLPVAEAMACGIPTIVSNTTSLSEIAGDASLLIDPYSIESITEALNEIISSSETRMYLKEKGIKHIARYTWEKTVMKINEVIMRSL